MFRVFWLDIVESLGVNKLAISKRPTNHVSYTSREVIYAFE
jgi:hypothetical protein